MKFKQTITSIVLTIVLLAAALSGAACAGRNKVKVTPEQAAAQALAKSQEAIRKLTADAERFDTYAGIAIDGLDEIKASGFLNGAPELDEAYTVARSALVEFRATTGPFLDLAKTFGTLDPESGRVLKEAFKAVNEALQELKPKIITVTTRIVEYLKRGGIVKSINVETIVRRVELALKIFDAAAKVINSRFINLKPAAPNQTATPPAT